MTVCHCLQITAQRHPHWRNVVMKEASTSSCGEQLVVIVGIAIIVLRAIIIIDTEIVDKV